MKQTKRIIALLLMTMLVAGAVVMNGCKIQPPPPRIDNASAVLEAKYGEKFNVRLDESYSGVFYTTCSPVNNPEVLFEARFSDSSGTTIIMEDGYYESYTASLINEIFEKDLQKFFPGAYFRTSIDYWQKEEFTDISSRSLEEMIGNADEEKRRDLDLEIFVDESAGTTKRYEEEYKYFTEMVDKYRKENKMLPLTISITKVDKATFQYIEEYFKLNAIEGSDFYERLNIGSGKSHLYGNEDTDPGETPRMAACFNEYAVVIEDIEEYIRRREIWEDAK